MPIHGYISDVDVKIDKGDIAALFSRKGALGRWLHRTMGRISLTARLSAPFGTGDIKAKHSYSTRRLSTYGARGTVRNRSHHAVFVHEGTRGFGDAPGGRGYIYSSRPVDRRGRRPGKLRTPWGFRVRVKGQRPNPWLARAAGVVLRRYGVRI